MIPTIYLCTVTKLSACMKHSARAIYKLHKYGMPHTWHLNPHRPPRFSLWYYHYSLHECLNEPTQREITRCNNLHSYQVFINKMLLYYQSPLTWRLQLYTVWHQFILIHAKNYIPVKIHFYVSSLIGLYCKTRFFLGTEVSYLPYSLALIK